MDKIGTATLIHAGLEVVIISGVTFYLNRRISSLQERIDIMQDTISKYEAVLTQQSELLNQHENILRRMIGAPPMKPHPQLSSMSPQ